MRAPFMTTMLTIALAACGSQDEPANRIDRLDAELTQTNGASTAGDPALRAALQDQIMVDPALTQSANADAIRPPMQPVSGAVPPDLPLPPDGNTGRLRTAPAASADCPLCAAARQSLTLGALAQRQGKRSADCAGNVTYSADWANRLPKAVPLYPGARVSEAAGADRPGCALRVVSFASAAPPQRLLDWYFTRTTEAGYTAQHQAEGTQHVLAGKHPSGGAFFATMTPRKGGGTDVDLMADGG